MPRKVFKGTIVSDKMEKTVVVAVEMPKKHPLYGKNIKNTKRFKARNEIDAKLGDTVYITESRPLSKTVSWIVSEVEGAKA